MMMKFVPCLASYRGGSLKKATLLLLFLCGVYILTEHSYSPLHPCSGDMDVTSKDQEALDLRKTPIIHVHQNTSVRGNLLPTDSPGKIITGKQPSNNTSQHQADDTIEGTRSQAEGAVDLQRFIQRLTGHKVQILKYKIRASDIPPNFNISKVNHTVCPAFERDWYREWPVLNNVMGAYITDFHAITLVTQISADRFGKFEQSLRFWHGPVSVTVYGNYSQLRRVIERLKEIMDSGMRDNIFMHAVVRGEEVHYPGNLLRNIARGNVQTEFSFLNDGDFVPSMDAEERLGAHAQKLQQKQVFVLPAFAFLETHPPDDFRVLESKANLVQNLRGNNATVVNFGKYNYEVGHRRTDFMRWMNSKEIYKIIYEYKFEPYVLMFTVDVLHYPETFLGYFFDKASLFAEMACSKYTYHVLPDVYVVHLYHPPTLHAALNYYECSTQLRITWTNQVLKQRYNLLRMPW